MAGTAEQQAPVRREPVVIESDLLITQGQIVRDQLRGACFGQRLGGNDVASGGQHFAAQLRFELIQVRVATEHQAAGTHGASGATHLSRCAMDDFQYRALLEYFHAK